MRRHRAISLVVVCCLPLLTGCFTVSFERHTTERVWLDAPGRPARTFHYGLYLPTGYHTPEQRRNRWPLLVYLPGCWSHGDDLRIPGRSGLIREIENGRELPMVVATPMPPELFERWSPRDLVAFLDHAQARYRIDPGRVYITGVSISGAALWEIAKQYPERVTAIVPVAGWGDPQGIERMVDVPVWAFHGALDYMIAPGRHARMVEALQRAGGRARWTLIRGGFHGIWNRVYAMDDVYDWLLAQRRPRGPAERVAERAPEPNSFLEAEATLVAGDRAGSSP